MHRTQIMVSVSNADNDLAAADLQTKIEDLIVKAVAADETITISISVNNNSDSNKTYGANVASFRP